MPDLILYKSKHSIASKYKWVQTPALLFHRYVVNLSYAESNLDSWPLFYYSIFLSRFINADDVINWHRENPLRFAPVRRGSRPVLFAARRRARKIYLLVCNPFLRLIRYAGSRQLQPDNNRNILRDRTLITHKAGPRTTVTAKSWLMMSTDGPNWYSYVKMI